MSGSPGPGLLPVDVVELELVRVAAVRSIVAPEDVPDFMSDALGLVAIALREAGIEPAGPPFARYFSMGADGLDMAAGLPVAEPFPGAGRRPPGRAARRDPRRWPRSSGPTTGLEAAWGAVRRRIGELGRAPGAEPWEVFRVGPGSGVDESEWRTELVWPLAPLTGGS